MSAAGIVGLVVLIVVVIFLLAVLGTAVNLIQQGTMGVVTRFGRFHRQANPGITLILPFFDRLIRVDMRETPRTGDRQDVITRDNVAVAVNATIFSQVIDAKAALFNVSNYFVAIDQQARTTLRNAFGNVSLDEALSQREQINAAMQQQMEQVTDKWGIRINRIEIVDISPPSQILQAMALQKQADQEKRARILQSEGTQQQSINVAEGARQAAIKQAEGERQATILRAEGARQAAILEAEGRAQAIATVYKAIKSAEPDPTLVAILQLDTLSKFADSDNTTVVVPAESAALMGAAQAVRSVMGAVPSAGGGGGGAADGAAPGVVTAPATPQGRPPAR
jgi:regulator of protease activity HflC (stomatin/prohibitin superfamily)